tara:strand:- start:1883 stop:2089 length:207 start_codon:yes stop_codon:yes gene_type:complete
VLVSKSLQLLRQGIRISIGKCIEAINPQLEKHLPPLGTDTTDLTEMSISSSFGVAHPSPAAQRTFTSV